MELKNEKCFGKKLPANGMTSSMSASAAINTDSEINVMGFLAVGNQLAAFANGEFLAQVEDTTFTSGNYGLYANAQVTPGLSVTFDDFKLWYVTP